MLRACSVKMLWSCEYHGVTFIQKYIAFCSFPQNSLTIILKIMSKSHIKLCKFMKLFFRKIQIVNVYYVVNPFLKRYFSKILTVF